MNRADQSSSGRAEPACRPLAWKASVVAVTFLGLVWLYLTLRTPSQRHSGSGPTAKLETENEIAREGDNLASITSSV